MNDLHVEDEIKIVDNKVYIRTHYDRAFDVADIDKMLASSARWVQTLLRAKRIVNEQRKSS